jgi:hypothetical protein
MNRNKLNIGESFEKFKNENFPHTPMKIHWIQDELIKLKGDGLLVEVIKDGALKDIISTLKMIMDYERDAPILMCEIVGESLLNEIDDWLTKRGMNKYRTGENDIPEDIFTSDLGGGEYVGLAD